MIFNTGGLQMRINKSFMPIFGEQMCTSLSIACDDKELCYLPMLPMYCSTEPQLGRKHTRPPHSTAASLSTRQDKGEGSKCKNLRKNFMACLLIFYSTLIINISQIM